MSSQTRLARIQPCTRREARWALVLVASLMLPPDLKAQTCFRGHPSPACSGFTVLEFTAATRLNPKEGRTDGSSAYVYWSFGYLKNTSARDALGAALHYAADSDGHRFGLDGRYRHWISGLQSLDLALGAYFSGQDNFEHLEFPSPSGSLTLNFGDRFAIATGVDVLRRHGGDPDVQGHIGLRLGTWLAPLATIGLGALVSATW